MHVSSARILSIYFFSRTPADTSGVPHRKICRHSSSRSLDLITSSFFATHIIILVSFVCIHLPHLRFQIAQHDHVLVDHLVPHAHMANHLGEPKGQLGATAMAVLQVTLLVQAARMVHALWDRDPTESPHLEADLVGQLVDMVDHVDMLLEVKHLAVEVDQRVLLPVAISAQPSPNLPKR